MNIVGCLHLNQDKRARKALPIFGLHFSFPATNKPWTSRKLTHRLALYIPRQASCLHSLLLTREHSKASKSVHCGYTHQVPRLCVDRSGCSWRHHRP
ncbi:hypothetical protein HDV57DRAFT_79822 [Trichoderma longibrachiatum]